MSVSCASCGTRNRDNAMFCHGCTAKMPAFAPTAPSALEELNAKLARRAAATDRENERTRSAAEPMPLAQPRFRRRAGMALVLASIAFFGWYAWVRREAPADAADAATLATAPIVSDVAGTGTGRPSSRPSGLPPAASPAPITAQGERVIGASAMPAPTQAVNGAASATRAPGANSGLPSTHWASLEPLPGTPLTRSDAAPGGWADNGSPPAGTGLQDPNAAARPTTRIQPRLPVIDPPAAYDTADERAHDDAASNPSTSTEPHRGTRSKRASREALVASSDAPALPLRAGPRDPRQGCEQLYFPFRARCEANHCEEASFTHHPRCDLVREQRRRDEARRNLAY